MSATELVEVTVADTGWLNNWIFTSRNHGLVGTRNVPVLLLDLDDNERVAGFVASTGAVEGQTLIETSDYLEVQVNHRRLHFCMRLPLPEYDEVADEIRSQGNVAIADFETYWGDDDRPRTAILLTFEC